MKKAMLVVTAAAMLCLGARPAQAVPLNPGDTASAGLTMAYPGAGFTLVDNASTTFLGVMGRIYGTVDMWAYRDLATNYLTFVYRAFQAPRASSTERRSQVEDVSITGFAGFDVSAGYAQYGPNATSGEPVISVERSPGPIDNGDVVGFAFTPPTLGGVGPGESTDYMIIATNATRVGRGTMQLQDGDNASVQVFAAAPEPGTLLLLGTGLAAAARAARRRKQQLA